MLQGSEWCSTASGVFPLPTVLNIRDLLSTFSVRARPLKLPDLLPFETGIQIKPGMQIQDVNFGSPKIYLNHACRSISECCLGKVTAGNISTHNVDS